MKSANDLGIIHHFIATCIMITCNIYNDLAVRRRQAVQIEPFRLSERIQV